MQAPHPQASYAGVANRFEGEPRPQPCGSSAAAGVARIGGVGCCIMQGDELDEPDECRERRSKLADEPAQPVLHT